VCVCVCVLKDAQGTRNMDKPSWIIIIDSDIDNVLYCGRTKSISTPMQVSRHPREGRNGGMRERVGKKSGNAGGRAGCWAEREALAALARGVLRLWGFLSCAVEGRQLSSVRCSQPPLNPNFHSFVLLFFSLPAINRISFSLLIVAYRFVRNSGSSLFSVSLCLCRFQPA
jgi:hypothetical protein